jgi:hypothetical protein
MRGSASAIALAALLVLGGRVDAQLGLYQLPRDDFRWNWGNVGPDAERIGMPDIQATGSESFFRCELTARVRASSTLSQPELRQMETDLRARLDFIYAASELMNYLDQVRTLDWAVLDCKKNQRGEVSAEESAERQSAARDKMLRELERRRARQQRDSD